MAIANAVDAGTAGFQSLTSGGVWNGRTLTPGTGISITNGDGTAGNPVISATGGSSGVNATMDFYDDFLQSTNGTGTGGNGDTNWILGGSLSAPTAESGRPGTISLAQTGYIYKTTLAGSPTILLGAGVLTVTWYIRMNDVSNFTCWAGLSDTGGAGEPANGVYFLGSNGVNSGKWVGKTASASVRSSANSNNAVSTSWVVLQLVVNAAASSVDFKIGSTLAGLATITNSPLAANIPTVALEPFCALTAGATGNLIMDLVTMQYALTTAR